MPFGVVVEKQRSKTQEGFKLAFMSWLCQTPLPVMSESGTASSNVPQVPDHTLLRRVGRGSYGEVWLGRTALGRFRAIKIVYRATFSEERPFAREFFGVRNFEPISRLHEGLVDCRWGAMMKPVIFIT